MSEVYVGKYHLSEKKRAFHRTRYKQPEVRNPEEESAVLQESKIGIQTSEASEWNK